MRFALLAAGAAFAVQTAQGPISTSQESRRTVWSGVYTDAQAARGASGFGLHCAACHAPDLSGGEGPALVGPRFMSSWTGLTLRELFHHIKVAMPEDAVSSVSETEKLDILAFIFQRNGFPSGSRELTTNPTELIAIAFEGRNGPEPPPAGSTVRTRGCLTNGPGGWSLRRASDPVRTTLEAEREAEPGAASPSDGAATIELVGVTGAENERNQTVKIVGFMIRSQAPARVNVLQISRVGQGCSPE